MKFIFNVNETTLLRFVWVCPMHRQVYFLSVGPWFPPLRRICRMTVDWAVKSGRAKDVMDLCPEHRHLRERFITIALYNIFGKIEAWQNVFFEIDNAISGTE